MIYQLRGAACAFPPGPVCSVQAGKASGARHLQHVSKPSLNAYPVCALSDGEAGCILGRQQNPWVDCIEGLATVLCLLPRAQPHHHVLQESEKHTIIYCLVRGDDQIGDQTVPSSINTRLNFPSGMGLYGSGGVPVPLCLIHGNPDASLS